MSRIFNESMEELLPKLYHCSVRRFTTAPDKAGAIIQAHQDMVDYILSYEGEDIVKQEEYLRLKNVIDPLGICDDPNKIGFHIYGEFVIETNIPLDDILKWKQLRPKSDKS